MAFDRCDSQRLGFRCVLRVGHQAPHLCDGVAWGDAAPAPAPGWQARALAAEAKVERLSALLREGLQLDRPLGAPALPRTLAEAEDLRRRALSEVADG